MPLGAAIACGLVAALFYFSLLTGSPGALILIYLVQLPLFGAGLALGVKGALVASGTAAVATAAGGGALLALIFLATEAMPVVVLVGQALRRRTGSNGEIAWYPTGRLVATLISLGATVLCVGFALLSLQPEGIGGTMESYLRDALGAMAGMTSAEAAPNPDIAKLAKLLAPLLPACGIIAWLAVTVLNGLLAQGALARFGWSRRPSPDIAELELPRWLAAPLAAALVLAVAATGDVALFGRNLLPILAFAYLFGGLAVLHAGLRRYPARLYLLVPSYLLLALGWPVLLVAACGIIDQWFGLRRFFAAASRQGD